MLKRLLRHGKKGTRLLPMLTGFALILSGCATKPLDLSVNCPDEPAIPAHLAKPSLPDASALSEEARIWLEEASNFLNELQQTKTLL